MCPFFSKDEETFPLKKKKDEEMYAVQLSSLKTNDSAILETLQRYIL